MCSPWALLQAEAEEEGGEESSDPPGVYVKNYVEEPEEAPVPEEDTNVKGNKEAPVPDSEEMGTPSEQEKVTSDQKMCAVGATIAEEEGGVPSEAMCRKEPEEAPVPKRMPKSKKPPPPLPPVPPRRVPPPPPLPPPPRGGPEESRQQRDKKRPCKFWAYGSCKFGKECLLWHEEGKEGSNSAEHYSNVPCKYYFSQRGCDKGDLGFTH